MRPNSIVCLASVAVSASCMLAQNLLVNGDFETPPAGGSFVNRSGGGLTGWAITGNIDHIGGFWAAQSGAQSLDLNGSTAASLSQSVGTISGQRYRLTYSVSENFFGLADKTLNVRWNGAIAEQVIIPHDPQRSVTTMRWQTRTLIVTASGSTSSLSFESTTGAMPGSQGIAPFYGPALDQVILEPATCAADFNADGNLDPDDLGDFITCFFSAPPCGNADFNHDTNTDPDDLGDFITAYFTGCP